MLLSRPPRLKLSEKSAPTAGVLIYFEHGFAIDFPGDQRRSILDKTSSVAIHCDNCGLLTCLEVMRLPREMHLQQVAKPERLLCLCPAVIFCSDFGKADFGFEANLTLDLENRICEAKLSEQSSIYTIDYFGALTFEAAEDLSLVRIVFDLPKLETVCVINEVDGPSRLSWQH
jgi:hypothetical protein